MFPNQDNLPLIPNTSVKNYQENGQDVIETTSPMRWEKEPGRETTLPNSSRLLLQPQSSIKATDLLNHHPEIRLDVNYSV